MKHLMLAACVAVALAARSDAGTITKATLTHQLSIKEKYLAGVSTTTLKFTLTTNLQAALTPEELGALGPDTLVEASFPVGPNTLFRLGDDPKFEPGDTAAKVTRTTVFGGASWKTTFSANWANGTLKLNVKATASQKSSGPSPIQWEGVPITLINRTTTTQVLVTVLGRNPGQEFLNLQTTVPATIKTLNTASPKSNGSIAFQSTQSVKGALL